MSDANVNRTNPGNTARPPESSRKTGSPPPVHIIEEYGLSRDEAARIRASLLAFEEDWNAPGMEDYDRL